MDGLIPQDEGRLQAELADRLAFEALLADISADFVGVRGDEIDGAIFEAQRKLCEFLHMDRSAVWQVSAAEPTVCRQTHFFGMTAGREIPKAPNAADYFPWSLGEVLKGRTLAIADVRTLPPEAGRDRECFEYYSTRSFLAFPLQIAGIVVGLVAFSAVDQCRYWPDAIVARCRLIAGVFASALARIRSEQTLRESEERYRTIAQNLPGTVCQYYAKSDGHLAMVYVDEKAREICGLAVDPLDTFFDRFSACVAEDERQSWLASIREAIAQINICEQEFRFHKPMGEEAYFRLIAQPSQLGGQLVFSGLILDVTVRKTAEIGLHRLQQQLEHENVYLRKEIQSLQGSMPIVGNSNALKKVIIQAQQVAPTDSTVLILGETGTGKELLASYLHSIGKRSRKPFIVANIAAIPATLLENELFGREKGAYTGAVNRQIGRFELADGGTLFLDEIGELPVETQAKLLRVLQSGTFERLGSSQTIKVNVQLIAATNRKLPELIQAGAFRQDLYYRLNVFPITLPPLRERTGDIPLLVWAFVKEFSERMGKPIERIRKKDMDALSRFSWPGNVRELRNVIERSVILTQGPELHVDLRDEMENPSDPSWLLRDVQRFHVERVLRTVGGRIRGPKGAAQALGLKPTTLYSLMERLGIRRESSTS